jgi:hypothetical protein
MKNVLLFFFILLVGTINAQKTWNLKAELRATIAPATLSAIAGSAWGVHEALHYRKAVFFRRFPGADRQYWDPAISWENKNWRNVPVQISDAKHAFATLEKFALFSAGISATIPIARRWEKKKWKHNLARIGLQSVATSLGYAIGNELTFTHFFKR